MAIARMARTRIHTSAKRLSVASATRVGNGFQLFLFRMVERALRHLLQSRGAQNEVSNTGNTNAVSRVRYNAGALLHVLSNSAS